jgi:hypothetical protein
MPPKHLWSEAQQHLKLIIYSNCYFPTWSLLWLFVQCMIYSKNIKNNQPISFYIVVAYVLLQLEVRDKVISVSAIVKVLPSKPIAWSRALNVASPLQQLSIAQSKLFFWGCKYIWIVQYALAYKGSFLFFTTITKVLEKIM